MIQPNDMTAKIDTGFDVQTLKKIALASAEIPSTLVRLFYPLEYPQLKIL